MTIGHDPKIRHTIGYDPEIVDNTYDTYSMVVCGTYGCVSFERPGQPYALGKGEGTVQMIHLHRSYMVVLWF